jgi:hypothetical protein
MSTGEDGDASILKLLDGSMLDGLLPDVDVLGDGVKELQCAELDADGAQCRARSIVSSAGCRSLIFHVADTPENRFGII